MVLWFLATTLEACLPERFIIKLLSLIYFTVQHGYSFTLLEQYIPLPILWKHKTFIFTNRLTNIVINHVICYFRVFLYKLLIVIVYKFFFDSIGKLSNTKVEYSLPNFLLFRKYKCRKNNISKNITHF